jgi:hypothetical protein
MKNKFTLAPLIRLLQDLVVPFILVAVVMYNMEAIQYSLKFIKDGNGRVTAPVLAAVERALLLKPEHLDRPIGYVPRIYGEVRRICDVEEMLNADSSNYAKCKIVVSGSALKCSFGLYIPECRSIEISNEVWSNEILRPKIMNALLNLCDFLIDVDEVDVVELEEAISNSTERYGYEASGIDRHRSMWEVARCSKGGINVFYISVHENNQLLNNNEKTFVKIQRIAK